MQMNNAPLVSIKCLVYNHEPYLRQCLNGFVMQKANFAFEAIVHDDASTDKSAEIIKEYAAKYPDIIKPIYETVNQYSKADGSITRIMNAAISPTAKYIAMCEGDDYWIDPLKLQKQVDWLEAHSDYYIVGMRSFLYFQKENKFRLFIAPTLKTSFYPKEHLRKWLFQTSTYCLRREYYVTDNIGAIHGDLYTLLCSSNHGTMKLKLLNDFGSVYRIHSVGMTASKHFKNNNEADFCKIYNYYDRYSNFKDHDIIVDRIEEMTIYAQLRELPKWEKVIRYLKYPRLLMRRLNNSIIYYVLYFYLKYIRRAFNALNN
jgi:glycosyltransferase involved in cell wall biosynthesis